MPTDPEARLDLGGEDGHARRLDIDDVMAVARELRPVDLLDPSPEPARSLERAMQATVDWVDRLWDSDTGGRAVYGINTGFGALSGRSAFRERRQARALMRGLITSHAAGAGADLPEEVVRAAILIRARQLAGGRSGIRAAVVNRLLGLLNHRVLPSIPRMGSLGASGDLAPLAHLALAISRAPDDSSDPGRSADGKPGIQMDRRVPPVWIRSAAGGGDRVDHEADRDIPSLPRWRRTDQSTALAPLGGGVILEAKEGLALTNGASFSAALAAIAVADTERLLAHAELAVAMVLEAVGGFRDPFLPDLVAARPYPGALRAARTVLAYTRGSERLDAADRDRDPTAIPPQDFYSLRCAPQVLGAGWDAVGFARRMVEVEINSAVDNPLIVLELPRDYKAISGGNFHGAPLGYALDLLKVVATDCASMSERRTFKLTDYRPLGSGPGRAASLPPFLVAAPEGLEGIYSGLMIAQYTAASLVSAAKTLSHPDSVDSIPSSAGQEDHVSMSMNAGLHARMVLEHSESVVAIELLAAAQAMDFALAERPAGAGTSAARNRLRAAVPFLTHDRALGGDIAAVRDLMREGTVLLAAREAAGLPARFADL